MSHSTYLSTNILFHNACLTMIVLIYLFNYECLIPLNLFCLITIVVLIYLFARLNLLVLAIITVHLLFITMKQTIIHDIHILFDETLRWRFIVVSLYSRSSNEAFPRHDLRRALFPFIKFVAPRTKKKKNEFAFEMGVRVWGYYLSTLVCAISSENIREQWSLFLIHPPLEFFFFFFQCYVHCGTKSKERERREREKRKMSMAINGGSLLHRSACSSRREIASTFVLLVTSDVNAILISVALPWNDWWQL